MSIRAGKPTGVERFFDDDQIIVSKTDLTGKLTYANDVFLEIADYSESEVIGMPHSMIRHPDMPRTIFGYLWERIQAGQEIFAYVVNLGKKGDHYWVLAHVTPTFDAAGRITGFHSNRRVPDRGAVRTIEELYGRLREVEQAQGDRRGAVDAGRRVLEAELRRAGKNYDEFIWSTIANAA